MVHQTRELGMRLNLTDRNFSTFSVKSDTGIYTTTCI